MLFDGLGFLVVDAKPLSSNSGGVRRAKTLWRTAVVGHSRSEEPRKLVEGISHIEDMYSQGTVDPDPVRVSACIT